jgi:hypothetical protein
LLSLIEALLLHGETRPMTGLPARATSATIRIMQEGYAVGEANRSLWPNSEVHEESLPAMPALLFPECKITVPQTGRAKPARKPRPRISTDQKESLQKSFHPF